MANFIELPLINGSRMVNIDYISQVASRGERGASVFVEHSGEGATLHTTATYEELRALLKPELASAQTRDFEELL